MLHFPASTFLFVVLILLAEGQSFPKSVITRNQARYIEYERCLVEENARMEGVKTQAMQSLVVRKGASVKLNCFQW